MGTRRQWPRPCRRDPDETFTFRDETEARRLQVSRRDRDVEMHVVINAVVNMLSRPNYCRVHLFHGVFRTFV